MLLPCVEKATSSGTKPEAKTFRPEGASLEKVGVARAATWGMEWKRIWKKARSYYSSY